LSGGQKWWTAVQEGGTPSKGHNAAESWGAPPTQEASRKKKKDTGLRVVKNKSQRKNKTQS